MEKPQSELGSIAADVIADLERIRKGWPATLSIGQIKTVAGERARKRLSELLMDRYGILESMENQPMFQREMNEILVPRYALLAHRQNLTEQRSTSLRGNFYNRFFYGLVFFLIGLFVVWAPFIPIWEKWIPFLFAGIAPIVSPWLPNVHQFLATRRHRLALMDLTYDLDQAGLA